MPEIMLEIKKMTLKEACAKIVQSRIDDGSHMDAERTLNNLQKCMCAEQKLFEGTPFQEEWDTLLTRVDTMIGEYFSTFDKFVEELKNDPEVLEHI